MSETPVVSIESAKIDRSFGESHFQLRVDRLDIVRGARVALVGPSGCGKSTLLDFLALILPPASLGAFRFAPPGSDPIDLAPLFLRGDIDGLAGIRRAHTGYVLQTGGLLSSIDVRRNIALPLRLLGIGESDAVDRIAIRLGIGGHLDKMPSALSAGERQRVAIARALVHRPHFVLADEPTASLDPARADDVMRLLVDLAEEVHGTLVVASHDVERVRRFGLAALHHEFVGTDASGTTVARFSQNEAYR